MNRGRGPLFWASAAAGWAIIGWGVRGALIHHLDTKPPDLVRFFLAGALIHDLIFAPVVLGAGVAVGRLVSGRGRAPVQAFLIIAGCAALFAWPEIRDYARVNHNPSSLPRNYTANLLVVAGAVLLGVLSVAWLHRRRATRGQRVPGAGLS